MGPLSRKFAPGRNYPRGVGSNLGHVREADLVRLLAKLGSQQSDVLRGLEHQHGLAGRQPVPNEGNRALEEGRLIVVEQRLVSERWPQIRGGGTHCS